MDSFASCWHVVGGIGERVRRTKEDKGGQSLVKFDFIVPESQLNVLAWSALYPRPKLVRITPPPEMSELSNVGFKHRTILKIRCHLFRFQGLYKTFPTYASKYGRVVGYV